MLDEGLCIRTVVSQDKPNAFIGKSVRHGSGGIFAVGGDIHDIPFIYVKILIVNMGDKASVQNEIEIGTGYKIRAAFPSLMVYRMPVALYRKNRNIFFGVGGEMGIFHENHS